MLKYFCTSLSCLKKKRKKVVKYSKMHQNETFMGKLIVHCKKYLQISVKIYIKPNAVAFIVMFTLQKPRM